MALVEQGSDVTGIHMVPESIEVSRARSRFFGLDEPALHHLNATEIDRHRRFAVGNEILTTARLEGRWLIAFGHAGRVEGAFGVDAAKALLFAGAAASGHHQPAIAG
jgi:hypothetical protein